MMAVKKRHWFWNLVIGLTILVCLSAYVLHARNWIKQEEEGFLLFSGFYFSRIHYDEIETISMVPRIPEMERKSGFSVWGIEKGVFRDTLEGVEGIRVYVDELKYPKILLQMRGSAPIYFNFRDSLETHSFYDSLLEKLEGSTPE
ncbi:hypothetical protein [Muriicola jejuensis]|uniref:Bacterial Pleckstrin homology domain-containing protein n=1 Tax=Muriicola jejuensis TaxID=504488 RepID=A0A6P0UHU2_9FLAO|nr:hypothetical protein [Muriicola jejuensis]NER09726.1 hypothetical protein [Muriicola jejuensis]